MESSEYETWMENKHLLGRALVGVLIVSFKEVAIQGRIRSKGLAQALNFKTMKDASGQRQMHHPYYNMSLKNFLVSMG